MADTGWLSPVDYSLSQSTDTNQVQFSNPQNIGAVDGTFATAVNSASFPNNSASLLSTYYNQQSIIPPGAAIDGIEVEVTGSVTMSHPLSKNVAITADGSSFFSKSITNGASVETVVYGGPTDMWGLSGIKRGGFHLFRVRVAFATGGSFMDPGSWDIALDCVRVKIYYTAAETEPLSTGWILPSSASSSGSPYQFTSPNNALTINGANATYNQTSWSSDLYLSYSTASIPTGSSIQGVEFEVTGTDDASRTTGTGYVGITSATLYCHFAGASLPLSVPLRNYWTTTRIYGSDTSVWGAGATKKEDLTNFRSDVYAVSDFGTSPNVNIDCIRARVFYIPPKEINTTNAQTESWSTGTPVYSDLINTTNAQTESWTASANYAGLTQIKTTLNQYSGFAQSFAVKPKLEFVGSASGTNTATMPAHQANDLILIFAYRDGSTTAPTAVAGYTTLNSGGNTNSMRLGWKIAASGSETVGTWTNATSVIAAVYRGVETTDPVESHNQQGAASTTVTYGGAVWTGIDGNWRTPNGIVAFAGHRSVNTTLETPPTSLALRTTVVDATDEAAHFDTLRYIPLWSGPYNVSVGGTSSGWRSIVVRINMKIPAIDTLKDVATTFAETEGWSSAANKLVYKTLATTLAETESWSSAIDKIAAKILQTVLAETQSITTAIRAARKITASLLAQTESWSNASPRKTKNLASTLSETRGDTSKVNRNRRNTTGITEVHSISTSPKRTRYFTTLLPETYSITSEILNSGDQAKEIETVLAEVETWATFPTKLRPITTALIQAETIAVTLTKIWLLETELAQTETWTSFPAKERPLVTALNEFQYSLIDARANRPIRTTQTQVETIEPKNLRIRNIHTTHAQTQIMLADPEEHLQDQQLPSGVIYGSGQTPFHGAIIFKSNPIQQFQLGTVYIYQNQHYVYVRSAIPLAPRQECNILSENIAFPGIGFVHDVEHIVEAGHYIWIRAVSSPFN